MAKKNEELQAAPTTLPAAVPDYGEMAGKGYENTSQSDFAIPLLTLLQDNHPQVKKSDPKYIPGAEAGMMLNSVTNEVIPGTPGIIFVPVVTQHVYVEFVPREKGGGFRGVHALDSTIVAEAIRTAAKFGEYYTPEGNELTETFYVYGYTLETPDATEPQSAFVIPVTSSKIKVYKKVMQQLRTFKGRPPLFANRLRITTKPEQNPQGSYFNFVMAPLIDGDVGKSLIPPKLADGSWNPLLVSAKQFADDVLTGKKKAAEETAADPRGGGGGAGGDQVFS